MKNPEIAELENSENFELIQVLEHGRVKEFVLDQISSGGNLIQGYKFYQILMLLTGLFFATRPMVLAFKGDIQPLFFLLLAVVFTFTLLILIHEMLHALAFKLTGARKVSVGWFPKQFIFFAEADQHVLNRSQFALVALSPLVVVQVVTLFGIIATAGQPPVYFWIFIMSAHSLFCAGDITMLDYFYRFKDDELFTYDVREERKSYFYRKRK